MRTVLVFFILSISIACFAITDGDVAASLRKSSEVQISSAHLARARATKADVREFAQNVIDSQTKMNKEIADILNRQKLKPDTTPESAAFIAGQTNQVKSWTDMANNSVQVTGQASAQMDRAYIDGQVEIHRAMVANLETQFIPNAQNGEFKTFLEKTKTDFQERLSKAQAIQTSLANQ